MLKETYTQTIDTARLMLRKFEFSDSSSVLKNWASLPEVQLEYGEPVYPTEEELRTLLQKYINGYSVPNYYRWAVIEKSSGECIGQIAYFLVDAKNEFAEIEYCIGTAFQGKGYATEACLSVIRYGFEVIGLHKVQICARPLNLSSRKVIEKCGFVYEGTSRDYFRMPDGTFEGRMFFSLINMSDKTVFESENIIFVPPTLDLVPEYLRMVNDIDNVARFIGDRREPYTEEEETAYISERLDRNAGMFSMLEKGTMRFIGNIEFFGRNGDTAEWGIVLPFNMQNKGYGKEALMRSIDYGFNELGLRRILITVFTDNARAIHLYEKCGFKEYDRNDKDIFMELVKPEV